MEVLTGEGEETAVAKKALGIVSACLVGCEVRHDGRCETVENPLLTELYKKDLLMPVCPELSSGKLGIPRLLASRLEDGRIMVDGRKDVTKTYTEGAKVVVRMAKEEGAQFAILKDGTTSCGSKMVYDGTFLTEPDRPGQGILAELLREAGVPVFSENEPDVLESYLKENNLIY